MAEETKKKIILMPEGQMVNGQLFEKDAYTDERTGQTGVPKYKIEVAFDNAAADEVFGHLYDYIEAMWGSAKADYFASGATGGNDEVLSPLIDGETLKRKRENKGKKGDAYAGKTVIRAGTIFNHEGNDAGGGIYVCDEDAKQLLPTDGAGRGRMYNGCMVRAAMVIDDYVDQKSGLPALMFYLQAVQRTGDGVKLVSGPDYSGVFKPTGRKPGADGAPPRRKMRPG